MWADQHDLSGFYGGGLGSDGYVPTLEQAKMNLAYSQQFGDPLDEGSRKVLQAAGIPLGVSVSAAGEDTVAIKPTTQDQVFNTINLVAQGILNERIAKQNVKMTEAQAKAAAEQAKAAATNYVMQSLQRGDTVLVAKGTVSTPSWAKWGGTALVVGGLALLGFALWKFMQKRGKAAPAVSVVPSAPSTTLSASDASMAASNPFRRRRRSR